MSTTTATNPPPPSALTSLISTTSSQAPVSALTTQILHNLQHQHLWTSLGTHEAHSLSETQTIPLIFGLPPNRVYTHPDEQAYMLENGIQEGDVQVEKEWVLPVAQGQTWSLRRLAGAFDALPERWEVGDDDVDASGTNAGVEEDDTDERRKKLEEFRAMKRNGKWGGKRLLLAMVNKGMGGDGTVVYYVVQEGIVKPRQN